MSPSPKFGTRSSFVGNYNLLAKLARGDLGDLYLARREGAGGFEKMVLIKRIHQQLTSDEALIRIFVDETKGAGSVDHPNVRQVYEFGRFGKHFFIALEYLEGVPLVKLLLAQRENPRLADPRLISAILSQVCEGIYAAHRHGGSSGQPIIHGNINPRGIFVTSNGNAKLLDLDIVDMRATLSARYGFVRRTFSYMSPEEVQQQEVTTKADIFSLGVVAWESMTGKRLFQRGSNTDIERAILNDSIPDAAGINSNISPRLSAALKKALQRNPEDRYENARAFGQELSAAALDQGPPLTPLFIADIIKQCFATELRAQQNFVRRARQRNEAEAQEDEIEEYTRIDSQPGPPVHGTAGWDSPSGTLDPDTINLDADDIVSELSDDPFVSLRDELEESLPEVFEWQDSSSIIRPGHLLEFEEAKKHDNSTKTEQVDPDASFVFPDSPKLPPRSTAAGRQKAPAVSNTAKMRTLPKKPAFPEKKHVIMAAAGLGVVILFLLAWIFRGNAPAAPDTAVLHVETPPDMELEAMPTPADDPPAMVFQLEAEATGESTDAPIPEESAGDEKPDAPDVQNAAGDPDPVDEGVKSEALPVGRLTLRARPRSAVHHGKKRLGTTPLTNKDLKPGKYRLRLSSRKRKRVKYIRVEIEEGSTTVKKVRW